VQRSNKPWKQEVETEGGRHYLARILPYAIGPSTYSGVILTFIDITETACRRNAPGQQSTGHPGYQPVYALGIVHLPAKP
jgi:hypothetical protein